MTNNRGALQISFPWLFAIIVGAFILFLAIYGVTKTVDVGQTETSAKVGKELGVLLNPLETGFESGVYLSLTTPAETRIFNNCYNYGEFGEQGIQVSEKNFNTWPEPTLENAFPNKYIFSANPVESRQFYIFSKPFEFPFKVANLIYLTSSEDVFCFVDSPKDIEEEITNLDQRNLVTEINSNDCSEASVSVCFNNEDCDIEVDYSEGVVEKGSNRIYFETDALMYGAIFSDANIYECQVERLMKRTESLVSLYKDKSQFIASKGCNKDMDVELISLFDSLNSMEDSYSLTTLDSLVQDLKIKNRHAECPLW